MNSPTKPFLGHRLIHCRPQLHLRLAATFGAQGPVAPLSGSQGKALCLVFPGTDENSKGRKFSRKQS